MAITNYICLSVRASVCVSVKVLINLFLCEPKKKSILNYGLDQLETLELGTTQTQKVLREAFKKKLQNL